ncbi:endoribonuclease xendoU domain-containing protein [Ditylenchus destructor]|nr:endoribonuclease xendoU domain-containing protein [Ditylenchus destructor]
MRLHHNFLLCFLTIFTSAHFAYSNRSAQGSNNDVPVWRRTAGAPTGGEQPIRNGHKKKEDGVVQLMAQTNESPKKRPADSPPKSPDQKRRLGMSRPSSQTVNPTSTQGMPGQKSNNLSKKLPAIQNAWRKLNESWRASGNNSSSSDPGLIKGIDWTYDKELDDLFMRMLQNDEESPWIWNAEQPLIEYSFDDNKGYIPGTLFKKVDQNLLEKEQYKKMKEILMNYNKLFQSWICEEEKPNKDREDKLDELWKIILDNKVFQIGLNYLADKLNVPRKRDNKNPWERKCIEDLAQELWFTKYSRCTKGCNANLPKTSSGFKHAILGEETCKDCNKRQCAVDRNRKTIKYMQGQHQWFSPYIAEIEGRLNYYDHSYSFDSWVDLRLGFKWSQSSDEIVRRNSHFQPYNSIAHDMALITVCALLPSVHGNKQKACPFKSRRTEKQPWEWYASHEMVIHPLQMHCVPVGSICYHVQKVDL